MKALLGMLLFCIGACINPAYSEDAAQVDRTPLAVCLQSNDPPLSVRAGDRPSGFDLALAQVIAQRLGRPLRVQWFVSRDDPDANLVKDTNALLSDGRCQLMAEYPLLDGTLQHPYAPTAKLPPFDGATPDDRRRWVKLNPLTATQPYRRDVLTVVLSPREAGRPVSRLADLDGLKIGVQIASLSDAIAMHYGNGQLQQHVVHLRDASTVFDGLQGGTVDAALIDLRAYDAWHTRHSDAGLRTSGYQHSLAFNMGFVGLAGNETLIRQVDSVLSDLQAQHEVTRMANEAGLTFVPPQTPAVQPDVRLSALNGD